MYAVSPEFLAAMTADLRHVKCRVTIDYTDPFIDQSITTTVNEQARISWPSQTANSRIAVPYWWAALDGTWKAGDGRHPMPDTKDMAGLYETGWWGKTPAGTEGAFSSPYPTLTVSHSPRPVHSLRVAGDSARNEYPVDFVVRLKDNASAVLHEETVTGNTKLDWAKALTSPVLEVASQELEIRKWSTPGRVVKITEFFTSIREVYDHDDIVSVRMLEEREPNHGMVVIGAASANEVGVVLSNADHRFDEDNDASHLYRLIKPNRRVKVELGTEVDGVDEWVPLGTYWVADWNTQDLETSLRALDILELLRTTKFLGGRAQQGISARELAELVLSDAGLEADDYIVDSGLEDIIIPWAWFPAGNYRDALSTIAEAGLAAVWADRDGKVHVERLDATPGESALTITGDDYFPPLRVTSHHEQTINEVVVTTQSMQPATITVVSGKTGTFSRDSVATNPDTGATVAVNEPRFVEGKFGQAVLVEEGTTNCWANPTEKRVGYEWTYATTQVLKAGETWTLSFDVKRAADSDNAVRVGWATTFYIPLSQVTDEYQRFSFTITPSADTSGATYLLTNSGSFWFRNPQLEQKPYATSFVDGTRAAETLRIPSSVMNDNNGTLEIWAKKSFVYAAYRKILDAENPRIDFQWASNGNLSANFGGANIAVSDPAQDTAWHHYALTYSGRTVKMYYDGALMGTGTATIDLVSFTDLFVGSRYAPDDAGMYQGNAAYSGLRLHRRALTDEEIAAHAQAPVWGDEIAYTFDGDLEARQATYEDIYRTTMRIPANSTVSVTAVYTQPPVFQATASVTGANLSITDADYFASGAVVSIKNSAATESAATLTINGLRLASASGVKVTARDEISYREHGPLSYEYPSNPLIQTAQHAQALADRLLAVAAEPTRGVELEWRGNPALEVGDTVTVVTDVQNNRQGDYRIVRQELQWAGALSATLTGRRITGQR